MATNQPIPFKQASTAKAAPGNGTEASPPLPSTQERPAGELGGHTVQPWEQGAVATTTTPNSKDVPPPEAGAPEARAAGTAPGMKTTRAPGNTPSQAAATPASKAPPLSTDNQAAAPAAPVDKPAKAAAPAATRPARPPVYAPQQGHAPAPRPVPGQQPTAPATDGDQLVESITKAIAENLAKALHQSIAQAVRDAMPLTGRSVAQPAPTRAAAKPGDNADEDEDDTAPVVVKQPKAAPAKTQPASAPAAKLTPAPAPSAAAATPPDQDAEGMQSAQAAASGGEQASEFGGKIEPPVPVDQAGHAQQG